MLEQVDLDHKTAKEDYKAEHDALMARLIVLQVKAMQAGIGTVVMFDGWKGAGKGSRISDLAYNLDARYMNVHTLSDFDVHAHREFCEKHPGVTGFYPFMQEFWGALGERGRMTIYEQGWYAAARRLMAKGDDPQARARETVESIGDFERILADNGYVVVKFFVHISQKEQERRLRKLADNPDTSWRLKGGGIPGKDEYAARYEEFDKTLSLTDADHAHWVLVNGEDKRTANLTIARTLVTELERALSRKEDPAAAAAAKKAAENSAGALAQATDPRTRSAEESALVLEAARAQAAEQATFAPRHSRFKMVDRPVRLADVDNTLSLARADYSKALKEEQKRLGELELKMYRARVPLMIVYEGDDAAGKGGNIKRVAQAIDARGYTVFPSAAPTKPELMHPFLWRYWTRLPKAGHVGIYDRSWYGRILVERVEGFASPEEVFHAYDEINEFERELVEWGAILLKFWVAVDPDEQLRRFEEREANPAKQWKITPEDWRNRDKHPQYAAAVDDMFRLTSTPAAPWRILESTDKLHARVKALRTINKALEDRLE
ncbi:polyphosphate--AMP phosphotransferase [Slackia exigua]|uniref:polyphosphate--AMP phosphotransferase n=1 Tax=Slackia exigua TaxID=84109 RepID=UPI0023F38CC8|nr:polyphosphate--AMP phosphotransferase [Slackia exigua]